MPLQPSTLRKLATLITSYTTNSIARYSTTMEDIATINCFFEAYLIEALISLMNQPQVDL